MAARISKRQAAIRDLEESGAFIGRDSLDAELRFFDAVERTIVRISEMPLMGRERSEFAIDRLAGLRSFPIRGFENWSVYYRPTLEGIDVIRILHGARDLGVVLGKEGPR